MAIAGAAFGASQALEEILGAQMLKAKLAEQQKADAVRLQMEQQRLAMQAKRDADDEAYRGRQEARLGAQDRKQANAEGVRRMIGEGITQRVPLADMEGMAFAEGVELPQAPQKRLRQVTTIGPKGEPLNRMAAEDEAVEEYREPRMPAAAPKPDIQWVELPDGSVREVPKGQAPPGSRPYTGTMSRDDANREVSASKQAGYVDEAINAIADLRSTHGQSGATGLPSLTDPGSWPRVIGMDAASGSPAATYDAKRRAVISKLVVPRLDAMRGLGQMSDREFANMVAGTTAMSEGRLSEAAENAELDRLEKFLQDAKTALALRGAGLGISVPPRVPGGGPGETKEQRAARLLKQLTGGQ